MTLEKELNQELIDAFTEKAKELMPHMDDLHAIDTGRLNMEQPVGPSEIEDYFFRKSEYLGGMAAVICSVLLSEE